MKLRESLGRPHGCLSQLVVWNAPDLQKTQVSAIITGELCSPVPDSPKPLAGRQAAELDLFFHILVHAEIKQVECQLINLLSFSRQFYRWLP